MMTRLSLKSSVYIPDVYVPFLYKYGIKQATTLLEVKGLFANLTVELEATVVR